MTGILGIFLRFLFHSGSRRFTGNILLAMPIMHFPEALVNINHTKISRKYADRLFYIFGGTIGKGNPECGSDSQGSVFEAVLYLFQIKLTGQTQKLVLKHKGLEGAFGFAQCIYFE